MSRAVVSAGGGDRVCETPAMSATPARRLVAGPSLADQAYDVLREMLASGALVYGERLTERALAARLGVSPTPVREAIVRLEHERLLERVDGRALRVVVPTLRGLREMALVQASLRGIAARLATANASDAELDGIQRSFRQTLGVRSAGRTPDDIVAEQLTLNRHFHQLIDDASHNPSLIDMIATTVALDWPLRLKGVRATYRPDVPVHDMEDHEEIVDALGRRDGARAEELCRSHALRGSDRYLRYAERNWPEILGPQAR